MSKVAALRVGVAAMWLLVAVPLASFAQGSITGTVKDASGAVLPGVTVEAASAALIEKVRAVVTDGSGQYRIVNLNPGTYSVTFTLTGFSTAKREGIALTGSFVATVNAEMKVGALEETITVTGEAPIVDIQSVRKEQVLTKDVIEALPTNKSYNTLAVLIPGMNASMFAGGGQNQQDVGGLSGDSQARFSIHGSRENDQRFTLNGTTFNLGNGQTSAIGLNIVAMEEVSVQTAGGDAALGQGGVRMNFVPRSGGNTFAGGTYLSASHPKLQADNITQELKDRGLPSVNPMKTLWDVAPTFGGPVMKNKLWFFASWRRQKNENYVAGKYYNANLANPLLWTFAPDLSRQIVNTLEVTWTGARVTWQATPKHKLAVGYDYNVRCQCANTAGTGSFETSVNTQFKPMTYLNADWTYPASNKLMVQGALVRFDGRWGNRPTALMNPTLISVTDNAPPASYGGVTQYRGGGNYSESKFPTFNSQASISYVTGANDFRVGFQFYNGQNASTSISTLPIAYTFTNQVPTSFTVRLNPVPSDTRLKGELGLYVQDKWTAGRATVTGAVRFDYLNSYAPPLTLGATPLMPSRNVTFPETPLLNWKDITPKVGMAYDVFGDGKTAVRTSLGKYLANQGAGGPGNPSSLYVSSASRSWTDANGNFVADCDWIAPAAQDLRSSGGDVCGALTGNNLNLGKTTLGAQIDPATVFGFGARPFNWEFSVGVQREIRRNFSMDVSYFRRWYGNFTVTDNTAVSASDYSKFSVTAPVDSRLPGGGGNVIPGFVNVNPDKASVAAVNYQTFSKNFGNEYEHWNGVDVTGNLRLSRALFFQGGVSTGKRVTDNCETLAKVPEANPLGMPYCHYEQGQQTQFKGIGSYTLPKINVQVSGTVQIRPGPEVSASYVATNAQVQPSLGRPLAGGAANVSVNIVEPGTVYGDWVNQVDLRFGKVVRVSRMRSTFSVDLFNLVNSNAVLIEAAAYSTYRRPQAVMQGRVMKFTAQVDF